MRNPLTRVLWKIVVKGFYREHTGLLFTLFILVFINFFYTNVLNQTHLTPDQIIETALKLAIATVSEPLGTAILFVIFLLYTIKTWQYTTKRLTRPDVQFLYYSSNALNWSRQIQCWLVIQFSLSAPITISGAYAILVGVAFDYWFVPIAIPICIFIINLITASQYVRIINNTSVVQTHADKIAWLRKWPKPVFSLFLYEILARKRVIYAVSKGGSLASIILFTSVFSESRTDFRVLGAIALCIALAHVVLIYQASEFELNYLRFTRNFPYSKGQIYCQQAALYTLLLLPEILWFLAAFSPTSGLSGAVLLLSTTLLFRGILYWLGQRMDYYLRIIFTLFICLLLLNLFGLTELLAISSALGAWLLLYRYQEHCGA